MKDLLFDFDDFLPNMPFMTPNLPLPNPAPPPGSTPQPTPHRPR